MRKNILLILFILFGLGVSFVSCDDDDNTYYDEAWKLFNDSIYYAAKNNPAYSEWQSQSFNGSLYYKRYAENDETSPFSKSFIEIEDQTPLFSDSVVCRYVGWFIRNNEDKTPYFFDGTENSVIIDGKEHELTFNKKQGVGFRVSGVIDGWATALQNMKPGDEVRICMPYMLGYGAAGLSNSSTGATMIPGYTTLWFDVKLLKIIRNK